MTSKKDYEVGYGKPPKATQFKPGQSGHPQGRPKKRKVGKQEIDLDELLPPRQVNHGGTTQVMSAYEIEIRQQLRKALKEGNTKAILYLIEQFEAHGLIGPPQVEGARVPRLPNDVPYDVAMAALRKHGLPPWSRAKLKPLKRAYLETRSEADRVYDDIMGYDLDV